MPDPTRQKVTYRFQAFTSPDLPLAAHLAGSISKYLAGPKASIPLDESISVVLEPSIIIPPNPLDP
ncbi:hypothetical protein K443DRAFT_683686 [Laccaria amethystina LaAM-08-1]|uniref:Uncharacterized protein n=1 Tax=Laccaria amethystina LaAM-08-1 TaxID=1095629 RepID=A0A0C9XA50_9AGAR|nr:hypothetical protein K443DRAFT_683686 [Laccaria amethystina LaAM-08-1]